MNERVKERKKERGGKRNHYLFIYFLKNLKALSARCLGFAACDQAFPSPLDIGDDLASKDDADAASVADEDPASGDLDGSEAIDLVWWRDSDTPADDDAEWLPAFCAASILL